MSFSGFPRFRFRVPRPRPPLVSAVSGLCGFSYSVSDVPAHTDYCTVLCMSHVVRDVGQGSRQILDQRRSEPQTVMHLASGWSWRLASYVGRYTWGTV
eukprot:7171358-Prymnesium_polylepis.1